MAFFRNLLRQTAVLPELAEIFSFLNWKPKNVSIHRRGWTNYLK